MSLDISRACTPLSRACTPIWHTATVRALVDDERIRDRLGEESLSSSRACLEGPGLSLETLRRIALPGLKDPVPLGRPGRALELDRDPGRQAAERAFWHGASCRSECVGYNESGKPVRRRRRPYQLPPIIAKYQQELEEDAASAKQHEEEQEAEAVVLSSRLGSQAQKPARRRPVLLVELCWDASADASVCAASPSKRGGKATNRHELKSNPFVSYETKAQRAAAERQWLSVDEEYMASRTRELQLRDTQTRLLHNCLEALRTDPFEGKIGEMSLKTRKKKGRHASVPLPLRKKGACAELRDLKALQFEIQDSLKHSCSALRLRRNERNEILGFGGMAAES